MVLRAHRVIPGADHAAKDGLVESRLKGCLLPLCKEANANAATAKGLQKHRFPKIEKIILTVACRHQGRRKIVRMIGQRRAGGSPHDLIALGGADDDGAIRCANLAI